MGLALGLLESGHEFGMAGAGQALLHRLNRLRQVAGYQGRCVQPQTGETSLWYRPSAVGAKRS